MSTFDGYVAEFPRLRIDQFSPLPSRPAPLACLLSHIHSDHLRGLESFKSPFIYCTHATRQLLLRLERYPHRLNFARGVLEARRQTYKHLKKLLRPLPLGTPTEIELKPGEKVRVTALDANHCPGACMFLIQGGGRSVLYTGDVRCETWFVERLVREPVMVQFVTGLRRLDCVFLDTSFASTDAVNWKFPSKAEGIGELLERVGGYGPETMFYFNTWTFGYEDVWVALADHLGTRIHIDEYRWRLYRSLAEGEGHDIQQSAPLVGFQEGHRWHDGCLTRGLDERIRIHSCERGMGCSIFKNREVVYITPIVTRHEGIEYPEAGAGGGYGDLNQIHELEIGDITALGRLMELVTVRLEDRPEILERVRSWLSKSVEQGASNIKMDTETFNRAIHGEQEDLDDLQEVPIDRVVLALDAMMSSKPKVDTPQARNITFPYSRHASYDELRSLIKALRPKTLIPNTDMPGLDMDALFGDLLKDRPTTTASDDGGPVPDAETSVTKRAHAKQIEEQKNKSSPKRSAPDKDAVKESLGRRLKAYRAALRSSDGGWSSVELVSVGRSHYEPEVEL